MPDTDPGEGRAALRELWASGDYAAVGDMWAAIGTELAAELGVAGRVALDAACGTGNTTLALARAGATTIGLDVTPELLEVAARRAAAEGLEIRWCEADLHALPLPDDAFDVVTSTFGVFTAEHPTVAAAELARVCRPGGVIALTAWAAGGLFHCLRDVVTDLYPQLDRGGGPDTAAWARRDTLDAFFAGTPARLVDLDQRVFPLAFDSAAEAFDFYATRSGPVMAGAAAVAEAGGSWELVRARVVARWQDMVRPHHDGVALHAPYARALLAV